jgi:hypothetical protein
MDKLIPVIIRTLHIAGIVLMAAVQILSAVFA